MIKKGIIRPIKIKIYFTVSVYIAFLGNIFSLTLVWVKRSSSTIFLRRLQQKEYNLSSLVVFKDSFWSSHLNCAGSCAAGETTAHRALRGAQGVACEPSVLCVRGTGGSFRQPCGPTDPRRGLGGDHHHHRHQATPATCQTQASHCNWRWDRERYILANNTRLIVIFNKPYTYLKNCMSFHKLAVLNTCKPLSFFFPAV